MSNQPTRYRPADDPGSLDEWRAISDIDQIADPIERIAESRRRRLIDAPTAAHLAMLSLLKGDGTTNLGALISLAERVGFRPRHARAVLDALPREWEIRR